MDTNSKWFRMVLSLTVAGSVYMSVFYFLFKALQGISGPIIIAYLISSIATGYVASKTYSNGMFELAVVGFFSPYLFYAVILRHFRIFPIALFFYKSYYHVYILLVSTISMLTALFASAEFREKIKRGQKGFTDSSIVEYLKKLRIKVYLTIVIGTAILTPDPTPFSMTIFSYVFYFIYEMIILFAKVFSKNNLKEIFKRSYKDLPEGERDVRILEDVSIDSGFKSWVERGKRGPLLVLVLTIIFPFIGYFLVGMGFEAFFLFFIGAVLTLKFGYVIKIVFLVIFIYIFPFIRAISYKRIYYGKNS